MLKLKKLNVNFSSIDPQGQESKAHRLWKWLMDNGSKTREEIYAFDRSYSTVLAKYWRNGLITLNGELYSAVPNYKFVDVRQIEDKSNTQVIEDPKESMRKNAIELEDIFFNDWKPQVESYKRKFVSLKTKVNSLGPDIDKLKDLEGTFNVLIEEFNSRIVSQEQVTNKYKDKVEKSAYNKIILMFGMSVREVNKHAVDCKSAIEARKLEIENMSNPEFAKYWSEILENGKWVDYKEWNSLSDLVRYMLGEYNNKQRYTIPNIFFGSADSRPSNSTLGSKIEDPTRFKTFAQLQREVKKRLNIK